MQSLEWYLVLSSEYSVQAVLLLLGAVLSDLLVDAFWPIYLLLWKRAFPTMIQKWTRRLWRPPPAFA